MTEQPRPHFLLVGDSRDLESIADMLKRLPTSAYGQVYLEVSSGVQITDLAAPAGMSITWLCRDRVRPRAEGFAPWQDDLGRPVAGFEPRSTGLVPRGELAARATAGWIAEWMPEERVDHGEPCVLWIGCSASPFMDDLYERLSTTLGAAHLHHPHHPQ